MANISINELSQTISELVNLDADQQKLIELAVDRAISTKDIVGGLSSDPVADIKWAIEHSMIAGGMVGTGSSQSLDSIH